ncbi:unnamed protein product [Sphacelaria rigidula]
MQTMYSGLAGSGCFTCVDLESGFIQLAVAKENRHLTASRFARGHLWQYRRCGFRLRVLPATFHRSVSDALFPVRGVKANDQSHSQSAPNSQSHENVLMTGLRVVLHRLLNADLTVNSHESQRCTQ